MLKNSIPGIAPQMPVAPSVTIRHVSRHHQVSLVKNYWFRLYFMSKNHGQTPEGLAKIHNGIQRIVLDGFRIPVATDLPGSGLFSQTQQYHNLFIFLLLGLTLHKICNYSICICLVHHRILNAKNREL